MYSFRDAGSQYIHKINAENFAHIALDLFRHQYEHCDIYRTYIDALKKKPDQITAITEIPFLPISFFKTHEVSSVKNAHYPLVFESSGTTGDVPSRHFIFNEEVYKASLLNGFTQFFGDVSQYAILALLPSYLERQNASLVHMAKVLMKESGHPSNGFYLNEWNKLYNTIHTLESNGQRTLLLGVTFALIDFATAFPMSLKHTMVMETGGMKGRKKEWTRAQVHDFLKKQWTLPHIHSEYGMTEMLSQAYAIKDGMFYPAATMKVLVRDLNDPLEVNKFGSGCINIIDLSNVNSCAFLATEDVGIAYENGYFEVLGRMDHAALRGCSLMTV